MKVEVGQIWFHPTDPSKLYRITSIIPWDNNHRQAVADLLDENEKLVRTGIGFGYVKIRTGEPTWAGPGSAWLIKYPLNTYTKISQKTLRKRLRDQIAAEVLAHRLTEPKCVKVDWKSFPVGGDVILVDGRTTMIDAIRIYQQRMLESLTRLT